MLMCTLHLAVTVLLAAEAPTLGAMAWLDLHMHKAQFSLEKKDHNNPHLPSCQMSAMHTHTLNVHVY